MLPSVIVVVSGEAQYNYDIAFPFIPKQSSWKCAAHIQFFKIYSTTAETDSLVSNCFLLLSG